MNGKDFLLLALLIYFVVSSVLIYTYYKNNKLQQDTIYVQCLAMNSAGEMLKQCYYEDFGELSVMPVLDCEKIK